MTNTNTNTIVKVCNPFGDQVAIEDIGNGKKLIKTAAGRTYLWNTLTQSFEGSSSSTTIEQHGASEQLRSDILDPLKAFSLVNRISNGDSYDDGLYRLINERESRETHRLYCSTFDNT